MNLEIGQRVVTPSGDVGVIEDHSDIEAGWVGVRIMTPDDQPSCCVSWCFSEQLRDGAGVVPMPRSKAWKAEAAAFSSAIAAALRAAGI